MSSLGIRLGLRALLVAALYSCLLSAHAHAVTTSWNTNSSGDYNSFANWDNGAPDGDDVAVFDRGFVAYEVNFLAGSISPIYPIDSLRVRTNEVSFVWSPASAPPFLEVLNPGVSIVVGEDAGDVAILNMTLKSLSGRNASIGLAQGAEGTLNVGGTFTMSGALTVGESGTGTLNVANGGRVETLGGVLGRFENSAGHASVSGANSRLVSLNPLTIGNSGAGTLIIQSGGSVISLAGIIGLNSNANGMVTVTGAGSTWTNRGVSIPSGQGTLTIEDGGAVASSFDSFISRGTVNVNGSGSTWTNDGDLHVGTLSLSDARLNISNGGAVSHRAAYIGTGANGVVAVDGPGSTWTLSGDLTVGGSSSFLLSQLVVSGGASVDVAGFLFIENSGGVVGNGTLSSLFVTNRGLISPGLYPVSQTSAGALQVDSDYLQFPTGKLDVQLGGNTPGTQYDQLQVTGNVTLSGTLTVGLINSFMPSVGDQFDILDWGSVRGTFSTLQLPLLAAGLLWDTSKLYTSVCAEGNWHDSRRLQPKRHRRRCRLHRLARPPRPILHSHQREPSCGDAGHRRRGRLCLLEIPLWRDCRQWPRCRCEFSRA